MSKSFCLRFPGMESSAPAFTKLSSVRRFASLFERRSIKSSRERKAPPVSRSRTISSLTAVPTARIAERPKRMPSPETENTALPSFTSGGRIGMPI